MRTARKTQKYSRLWCQQGTTALASRSTCNMSLVMNWMAINAHYGPTQLCFLFVLLYFTESNVHLFSEKMGPKIAWPFQLDTKL